MTTAPSPARWERFETDRDGAALAEALAPLFTLSEPETTRFPVEFDACAAGGMLILRLNGEALRLRRAPAAERSGGWDHRAVLVARAGSCAVSAQGRSALLAPDDHVLLDMTRSFEITAAARFEIQLFLWPRSATGAAPAHGLVRRAQEGTAAILARHADYFRQEAPGLDAQQARAVADALVRLAAADDETTAPAGRDPATGRLAELRRLLGARAGERDLKPEAIVEALGVSRAALYRAAAPEGGIAAMLGDARLRHAAALLLSPQHRDRRIGDIADASGFSSALAFSRRFSERFGLAPLAFRACLRASGEAGVDPRFALWLSGDAICGRAP